MSGIPLDTRDRGWIAPTLLVLGVFAVVAAALLPAMYLVGREQDDRRIFLRDYRVPNEFEAFSSFCMDYILGSDEPNDVIFVGDSSLRYGLNTREFERKSALRAYNLGSVGVLNLAGYTCMLEAYLTSRHPKPRLVVLAVLPTSLDLHDDEGMPQEMHDVKPRFLWCYGEAGSVPRPHNSFAYLSRQGFKHVYGLLVGGFAHFTDSPIPGRSPETYHSFRRISIEERGYSIPPNRLLAKIPPRDPSATRDPFRITDRFAEELDQMIRLTSRHGVPLLIRLTPFSGSAPPESPTLRAWADRLESQYPHVHVDRPEVLLYETSLFFDPNHLTLKGASLFTDFVARQVRAHLESRFGNRKEDDHTRR